MNLVYVFLGGGLGAALRWLIAQWMGTSAEGFPMATLSANLIGCFLIGVLSSFILELDPKWSLFLMVGLLGGFTTFSSFGLEFIQLYEAGKLKLAFSYVLLSNLFGLLLVVLGMRVIK